MSESNKSKHTGEFFVSRRLATWAVGLPMAIGSLVGLGEAGWNQYQSIRATTAASTLETFGKPGDATPFNERNDQVEAIRNNALLQTGALDVAGAIGLVLIRRGSRRLDEISPTQTPEAAAAAPDDPPASDPAEPATPPPAS